MPAGLITRPMLLSLGSCERDLASSTDKLFWWRWWRRARSSSCKILLFFRDDSVAEIIFYLVAYSLQGGRLAGLILWSGGVHLLRYVQCKRFSIILTIRIIYLVYSLRFVIAIIYFTPHKSWLLVSIYILYVRIGMKTMNINPSPSRVTITNYER